jgi:uncharacterized RDD family membrane protein YckC
VSTTASTAPVAKPIERLASWAIDLSVIATVMFVVGLVSATAAVLVMIAGPVYYAVLVSSFGGTLGHRAMGLSVRDLRSDMPVVWTRAVMRPVVAGALAVPCGVPVIALVVMLFRSPTSRAWHDDASQCVVRRVGRAGATS